MTRRSLPLRTQILLVVLGGAILPLGLVGVWLTRSAVRSGEALLQSHLETSAERLAAAIEGRWRFRQAELSLIAGNDATVRAVSGAAMAPADSAYLLQLASDVDRTVPVIVLRDRAGNIRWSSDPGSRMVERGAQGGSGLAGAPPQAGPQIRVELPILDALGERVGTATVSVALSALLPADSARPIVPGAQLAVRATDPESTLLPLRASIPFPDSTQFAIGDSAWMATQRYLTEPALAIAMAAPLAPYVDPFERAAGIGVVALAVVSLLAMLLVAAIATQIIRPLDTLAAAAEAVSTGALDQRVVVAGPREVRHVGQAFNVMTEQLRRTIEELSRRSALAAVGEFATSLSHDVRNALTAIKVDLERAERREVSDPVAQELVERAVNNVARLESVVTGALRVARSGQTPLEDFDLREPIEEAAATVRGTLATIKATLHLRVGEEPMPMHGDRVALQQLFGNLLFNAAQALHPGGEVRVSAEVTASEASIAIADNGVGIATELLDQMGTPAFPSRRVGTGLGIPIAQRIAAAHGGALTLESEAGRGTVVRVRLPLVNGSYRGAERVGLGLAESAVQPEEAGRGVAAT